VCVEHSDDPSESAGLPWVWVWVWDGYGDCDEFPWVCGESMWILHGCEISRKRV